MVDKIIGRVVTIAVNGVFVVCMGALTVSVCQGIKQSNESHKIDMAIKDAKLQAIRNGNTVEEED